MHLSIRRLKFVVQDTITHLNPKLEHTSQRINQEFLDQSARVPRLTIQVFHRPISPTAEWSRLWLLATAINANTVFSTAINTPTIIATAQIEYGRFRGEREEIELL